MALIQVASPGTAVEILNALICEAALFFNLGNNMNQAQVKQTSELILGDPIAKNLKPEDYRVLFNNAKKGLYGKTFNRLDGQIIFEWVHSYASERMDYMEQNSIKEHSQKKRADNLVHPEVIEMYKKILESKPKLDEKVTNVKMVEKEGRTVYEVEKTKVEDIQPQDRKVREKTPKEVFVQKCFNEFESIYAKDPVPSKVGRFILFEELEVDQVEYTEIKLKREGL